MDINAFIFNVSKSAPGLLFAIIVREWAQAYMAKRFGDLTAERAGRLTFNPVVHIDTFGTIIFPLISIAAGWGAFGWAKPVPVDRRNFSDMERGIFWVAFSGPLANFIVGLISSMLFVISSKHIPEYGFKMPMEAILEFSILINFIFMGLHLIPLPPLDGSKLVARFLKGEARRKYEGFARYSNQIFMGLFLLAIVGNIHILGYILLPFQMLAGVIVQIFAMIL